MIKVEGLAKRYARTVAVDSISFEVEKGGIVGFLGPNGAGKTTTMRILTCLLPPTSGSASVAGFDVLGVPACFLVPRPQTEDQDPRRFEGRGSR
jgi:ABC-2 type transport system ATP-binding protein